MIRFLLILFLALPVMAAVGPASFTNSYSIYVDVLAGNDATGVKYTRDKPFRTGAAAKAVATAGDTIYFLPGKHLVTNILKNGVNYFLHPGAIWTNMPGSAIIPASHDMMNDLGGATTNTIDGAGEFHFLMETNQTLFATRGAIVLTNRLSRVKVTGSRMLGRHFATIDQAAVQIDDCADFSLTLDEYYDPDIDRVSHDAGDPETEINSKCTFVSWINGECDINVKRASTESGYVLWSHGKTNTLNWTGHRMLSKFGNALYVSSSNNIQKTWIKLTETLEGGGQAVSAVDKGGGRVYLDIPKIRGGDSSSVTAISIVGHEYWIKSQKLSASSAGDTSYGGGAFITCTSGKAFIEIDEYDCELQMVGPGIVVTGGSNTFVGGKMMVTNAPAFIFKSGQSRTELKDMDVNTFSTVGTGATNECVTIYTNPPTFFNVALTSPSATVPCITSTNVNLHIKVKGILSLNNGTTNTLFRATNSGIIKVGNAVTITP